MIKNTHVHFKTFEEYNAVKNNIDENSIVFVGDNREIWTHGEKYGGNYEQYDDADIKASINSIVSRLGDIENAVSSGLNAQITDPTTGQILIYNPTIQKWVNLDGNWVTAGYLNDNGIIQKAPDQTVYGNKNFKYNVNVEDKLTVGDTAKIVHGVTAQKYVVTGYDEIPDGDQWILCADGSLRYLPDIIAANPGQDVQDSCNIVINPSISGKVSWKVAGKDNSFVSVPKQYTITKGEDVQIEFDVAEGYEVNSIIVGRRTIPVLNNSCTISAINENASISIVVTEQQTDPTPTTKHTISVTAGENGAVMSDSYQVTDGQSITITFVPDQGYKLDSVYRNGQIIGTINRENNSVTIENVTENMSINATFSKKTYTVTAPATIDHAILVGNPTRPNIEHGSTIEIEYNVEEGYELTNPSVGTVVGENKNIIRISSVTSDISLTVSTKLKELEPVVETHTIYYGMKDSETISDVTGLLSAENVGDNVSGTFTSTGEGWWWIVIPSNMTIDVTKAVLNGFVFQIHDTPISITIGGNLYNAYHSEQDYYNDTYEIKINN